MIKKSVISLISYDAHMLPSSIKTYYNFVDEIILGLDEDRISWSGNKFTFDEEKLWAELQKIDSKDKISIIESNFHKSNIAIQNDNHERNFLKAQCTHDWIFSFDADEQLVNAKDFFVKFLPLATRYYTKWDFTFRWFTPYKKIGIDYLVIANENNRLHKEAPQGFATHKNNTFTYARWTNNQKHLLSPLCVLHWSLCREKDELHQKITNIGHSDIAEKDPFYDTWQKVTLDNFEQLKDFKTSGFANNQWPKLVKIPEAVLTEICEQESRTDY